MKTIKQALSISMSAALALTSMPWTATAAGPMDAGMPAFAQTFAPAEQFGYVASSYSPSADIQRPRLIIISDLHGHAEVQHHIVDMLEGTVNKLTQGSAPQKQVQIFVEGGWEQHLEHPLASIKNPKIRATLAEYFLNKAEIPAAQAYSERHPDSTNVILTGAEDKNQYEANRQKFAVTYPMRKQLLEAIARRESSLDAASNTVEGQQFSKLREMRSAYERGTLDAMRYSRALLHAARQYSIHGYFVTVLQQGDSSDKDFDVALSEVHRQVTTHIAQSRPFMSYFRKGGANEEAVRKNLVIVDAYLDLLKRVLSDQLTPEEVPYAYAHLTDLTNVAQILIGDDAHGLNIGDSLKQSLAFYPFAIMRNESLVANSLNALQKGDASDTGILVVGGFHTNDIGDYLRARQIPYLLINPVVSRDLTSTEQLNYVKRMGNEHVTPAEVFADFSAARRAESLNQSDAAAQSVSDAGVPATTVVGDAPIAAPAAEAVKAAEEGQVAPGAAKPENDDGGTLDGLSGVDTPEYGIIGNPAFSHAVESHANGLSSEVANDGLVATVNAAIKAASVPVEAKIAEAGRAEFVVKAGRLVAADGAKDIQALADLVFENLGSQSLVEGSKITLLPTIGDTQVKFDLKMADGQIASVNKTEKAAVVSLNGGADHVVFINQNALPNAKAVNDVLVKVASGEKLSEHESSLLDAYGILLHELGLHIGNGLHQAQEVEVKAATIGAVLKKVAQVAAGQAFDQTTTGGLSIATKIVSNIMSSLTSQVSAQEANAIVTRAEKAAHESGAISLEVLAGIITDVLNPQESKKVAQARLADLESRLQQKFPQAPAEMIEQTAKEALAPAFVLAGVTVPPLGDPEEKAEKSIVERVKGYIAEQVAA